MPKAVIFHLSNYAKISFSFCFLSRRWGFGIVSEFFPCLPVALCRSHFGHLLGGCWVALGGGAVMVYIGERYLYPEETNLKSPQWSKTQSGIDGIGMALYGGPARQWIFVAGLRPRGQCSLPSGEALQF